MRMMDPGTLTVTRLYDPVNLTTRLRIDQADPVVWISDELLDQIEIGQTHPDVAWDAAHRALIIKGENLTVIYRVTDTYDFERCCSLMVWPD